MPSEPIFPDAAREFLDDAPERASGTEIARTSPTVPLPAPLSTAPQPTAPQSTPPRSLSPQPEDAEQSATRTVPQLATRPDQERPDQKWDDQKWDDQKWADELAVREARASRGGGSTAIKLFGISLGVGMGTIIGLALAVLIAGFLLFRGFGAVNPFRSTTVDRTGPAVVTAIQDLKNFQAASGHYEIVVDVEQDVDNLPADLAGERVLFVGVGDVAATVDFSTVGPDAVKTNAERTEATITLPAPTVGKAQLDLDSSYVAMHQRGLKERLQDAFGDKGSSIDTEQVYRAAEQKLTAAAEANNELRARAESNTRAMLTALLGSLGYTTVTVNFEQEP